ncbi:MAG: intradiol ring-cleavage dioxygenase [Bacteroidota bacterium]
MKWISAIPQVLSLGMLMLSASACQSQPADSQELSVGGPCQDCEAALDYKLLNIQPIAVDTLLGFFEAEPTLVITGRVWRRDGQTPAEDVILYVYHTDRQGVYQPSDQPIGWEKRHGAYRGWMKTDSQGEFRFFTSRPAPYPEMSEPEHIHIYVKEAGKTPYYLDNFMFWEDSTLTEEDVESAKNRGGSGIIHITEREGILYGKRDIILGLNIPDYR